MLVRIQNLVLLGAVILGVQVSSCSSSSEVAEDDLAVSEGESAIAPEGEAGKEKAAGKEKTAEKKDAKASEGKDKSKAKNEAEVAEKTEESPAITDGEAAAEVKGATPVAADSEADKDAAATAAVAEEPVSTEKSEKAEAPEGKKVGKEKASSPAADGGYTVQAGDTLGSIAQKVLGDKGQWKAIAELNNLQNPNLIFPGQTLKMPAK